MRDRRASITRLLHDANLSAAVCCRPPNVLACTGYWPVVGNSLALVTADGGSALIVPEDEKDLSGSASVDEIFTYEAASLENLKPVTERIAEPLRKAADRLGCARARFGHDAGPCVVPATYVGTYDFGVTLPDMLGDTLQAAAVSDVSLQMARVRAALTDSELRMVQAACHAAAAGFTATRAQLESGTTERETARALSTAIGAACNEPRAHAFGFCMSGPNSANAYRAYQLPTSRALDKNDVALLHTNSVVGGFWTDISRTYRIGNPPPRVRTVQETVLEATRAALDAIRPGVSASAVDRAARAILEKAGWGKEFRHATGHGVGFAAIDHNAYPRLHPQSNDILEEGMVFNVEPAAYFPESFGVRQCNMVAVTARGCDLLTPFDNDMDALAIEAA